MIVAMLRCRSGNFAISFAVLIPVLLGLSGGALDFMIYTNQIKRMQNAADTAVLAAAKESSLKGWSALQAQAIAQSYVDENLRDIGAAAPSSSMAKTSGAFTTITTLDQAAKTVNVEIQMNEYPYFFLGYFRHDPQIAVASKASVSGEMNICVIGLDKSSSETVSLSGAAKLTSPKCAIFSNSMAKDGLAAKDFSVLTSDYNCSAGGYGGASKNYSTQPTPDCTPVADPLAARSIPTPTSCDYTNKTISAFVAILKPGVYCGGINISLNANVLFSPGTYVIKNGDLKSTLGGITAGKGVTFFFTGEGSKFNFAPTTTIAFSAPETGPYAGILFYQDPKMINTVIYEVSSSSAGLLLGTIYLPNGVFKVHARNKIGDQSAYTVIVARKLDIGATAELVINADYAATKVPLPAGLGPTKNLRLIK